MLDITPENVLVGSIVPENLSLSVSCEKNREQVRLIFISYVCFNYIVRLLLICFAPNLIITVNQL